jgi:hypothetical protein
MQKHRDKRLKGIGRATKKLGEETIDENAMDSLKKIVSRQTAETIRLADGSRLKVDMTTANALLGVHGALNIHNQKKMADTLNSNKAGFAKMSKFAFKQFGSRPGKVGTPNTGVQEGSLKLANKPFDAGDDKIGPKDKAKKREARELARSTGPSDQGGRGRATGSWGDRGKGSTPARGSGNRGATTRPHADDLRNKRTDYSEYTPDHGETFAETENVVPGGSYTKAERKAAADRARAARFKRDVARMTKDHRKVDPAPPQKPNSAQRAGRKGEYVGEASDEKEYDNYPWTKGDLSPKQVRAKKLVQLKLVKKMARERARERKGGGTSDVKYDEKIGRG